MWAQGQIEEKQIKVEKYYRPKFEVFVRMPTFVFDTDQVSASSIYSFCWRIFWMSFQRQNLKFHPPFCFVEYMSN